MNTTPTHTESPEELDRLFSEFFKSQLKHPWPNCPVPASAEPARATPRRDSTARARLTLAASVALMLGTCWYMSDGFRSGPRAVPEPNPSGSGLFNDSDAKGTKGGVLDTINKNKANDNGDKMDLGKFE